MSDKRSRRRLFGKPIPNPIEEAEKVGEAAKAALAQQKNGATAAAGSAVSSTLSSAAEKVAETAMDKVGETAAGVSGRLNDQLVDINAPKLGGVAGLAGAATAATGVAGSAASMKRASVADAVQGVASSAGEAASSFKQGVAGAAGGLGVAAEDAVSGSSGAGAGSGTSGASSTGTGGNSGGSAHTGGSSVQTSVQTGDTLNTVNTVNTVNRVKTTEWVPSRGKRALPLALGALGLVGLTSWQAFAANGKIEDNLRKQSLGKLKDEFPDLKVRIEGRDAYLDGTVVDAESRKRAHDLVRRIKGVRHVEDPKVVSPAPAKVAAEAQVPLTVDTTAPLDAAADGMVSLAEVTGDTVPETTTATTAAPAVAADSVPVESSALQTIPASTAAPTTVEPTTVEPTTVEPTTVEPTTVEATTVVPASVLANSVPTTIVVAPTGDQRVAAVVPAGEPIDPIRFGRASTALEPATSADIDRIAAFMSANPNVEIGVAGYADSRGTKLQNMALAKVRAENVRQALIDRGIAAPRIKAVWFGDRSPVANNATENGRAFNRRVEFRFFDAAIDAASAYGQDVSFTG